MSNHVEGARYLLPFDEGLAGASRIYLWRFGVFVGVVVLSALACGGFVFERRTGFHFMPEVVMAVVITAVNLVVMRFQKKVFSREVERLSDQVKELQRAALDEQLGRAERQAR